MKDLGTHVRKGELLLTELLPAEGQAYGLVSRLSQGHSCEKAFQPRTGEKNNRLCHTELVIFVHLRQALETSVELHLLGARSKELLVFRLTIFFLSISNSRTRNKNRSRPQP